MHLLALTSPKALKGAAAAGVLPAILYLDGGAAPIDARLCPAATPECRSTCLVSTAGRARFSPAVLAARRRRREWLQADPAGFVAALKADLLRLADRASRLGLTPAVRLNGGSDLDWDGIGRLWAYADSLGIRCWEYTKRRGLAARLGATHVAVTFSYSGTNWSDARAVLDAGGRVAVVVAGCGRSRPVPPTIGGYPVTDGDLSDFRWTDPPGHVVALRAKGAAVKAPAGPIGSGSFVVATSAVVAG